jgi:amidophosphoribosyltransferase
MVTYDREQGFSRSIHSLERNYFRTKFEDELGKFTGNQGVGVISDTDPQPIIVNSHLGRYAVVTVARINNLHEIADDLLKQRMHLSEMSANNINQTEMVALLINMGNTFVEGINNVFQTIKGSCSMLVLTEDGIIAARDILGRTPLVIGHKEGAYAVSSETSSFPNLDYDTLRDIGPGEVVRLRADGIEVLKEPITREQVCSFLWVYYGFPSSSYEGINVEAVRERNGKMMGQEDDTEADLVCGIPDSGVGMAIGYAEGHGIPYSVPYSNTRPPGPASFTRATRAAATSWPR